MSQYNYKPIQRFESLYMLWKKPESTLDSCRDLKKVYENTSTNIDRYIRHFRRGKSMGDGRRRLVFGISTSIHSVNAVTFASSLQKCHHLCDNLTPVNSRLTEF